MEYLKLGREEMRAFIVLMFGCVLGSILILPYSIYVVGVSGISFGKLVIVSIVNSLIVYPIPIYVGLLLKRIIPVAGAPFLEGRRPLVFNAVLKWGVVSGFILALGIGIVDIVFQKVSPEVVQLNQRTPPFLYGLLASFYGGFVEEVLCRLFLMGLLLFLLRKVRIGGVWVAILLAAMLFSVGHLPATAKALALSSIFSIPKVLIARSFLLNGIAGVLFGWLYWRKGLELAILCHLSTDVGLQLIRLMVT